MEFAKSKSTGKVVSILESNSNDEFICINCGEEIVRNYGKKRQYYAHKIDNGNDCELKVSNLMKLELRDIEEGDVDTDLYLNKLNNKPDMELGLTKQQQIVVDCQGKRVKVESIFGSGKSFTAYHYAKKRPDKEILYLVYNASMKSEAEELYTDLHNVEVRTMHSLAYKHIGYMYRSKLSGFIPSNDVMKVIGFNPYKGDFKYFNLFEKAFESYLVSKFTSVEDYINDSQDFDINANDTKLIKDMTKLFKASADLDNKIKITHDFYFKLFHIANIDLSLSYDTIIVDEFQDVFPAVLDMINTSKVDTIVTFGDSMQSIYGWRGATNALDLFESDTILELSNSFRIGETTAKLIKKFRDNFTDKTHNIVGLNNNQRIVESVDIDNPYGVLCRTNGELMKYAINFASKGSKIYFEGGYKKYDFSFIKSVYGFKYWGKSYTPFLKQFDNYSDLGYFGKTKRHSKTLQAMKLIDMYGKDLIHKLNSVEKSSAKFKDADLILTTVHKAKGKTYTFPIKVLGDVINLNDIKEDSDILEELNVLSVAISRAKSDLELPSSLIRWYEDNKS